MDSVPERELFFPFLNMYAIFEPNASINFEPIFEKSVNFGPIFKKSVNFEHFVNGRWTHYYSKNNKLRWCKIVNLNAGQIYMV